MHRDIARAVAIEPTAVGVESTYLGEASLTKHAAQSVRRDAKLGRSKHRRRGSATEALDRIWLGYE